MRATRRYKSLPYNPALKERARALRRAGNLAEVLLWNQLKSRQVRGLDFDRQKIIGNYIVDFYCAQIDLVIEVDGYSHEYTAEYDARRDKYLTGLGLQVVHLLDSDIKHTLDSVMIYLNGFFESIATRSPPRPSGAPLQGRGIPGD
ncbi:MAG: DUF559 domain-containing protein [Marinagarivorans sp.]